MANQWIHARQTKYAAYAVSYILIVIAAVVVANVLADRYNKSYDATANKRFSLSDQTAKIVKGLKQDATITYYNQSTRFRDGKDLLEQYANLSPRLHVKYVDPDKEPELAREAGIRNLGTAVVQVGAKKEEAKSMTEEGITGAFIRDLKSNTRTVCFASGSGEHQIDDSNRGGLSHFKELLAKDDYESKSVDLLTKAEVPGECTTLVVAGPTKNYEQPEVDAIKKYVEDGGRAFFMLDPPLKLGHEEIADNDALTTLLSSWGITLDKDLILDLNPLGQIAGLGPQVALVTSYGSQPIVEQLRGTATGFPLARSLQIKNTDKTNVQKLFDSSSTSLATSNLSSPSGERERPQEQKGATDSGGRGHLQHWQGEFARAFCGGGFLHLGGQSFHRVQRNNDLASNAVNWLSSDEDLISIRPKQQEDRRITMTGRQLTWVRTVSQFVLPFAVVIVGVSVWWKRR
jgi:ABC-type uncharacterized transport system involved in gliding motility auxiliary subunit